MPDRLIQRTQKKRKNVTLLQVLRAALLGFVCFVAAMVILPSAEEKTTDTAEPVHTPVVAAKASASAATATQTPAPSTDVVLATTAPAISPTAAATALPTRSSVPTAVITPAATSVVKPGIDGSSAYSITVALKELGFEVGPRQTTSDGYSWAIACTSEYGSYTISLETNRQYEIHRAVFAHAGTDATFFPWAATLPFDGADTAAAVAWIKACQSENRAGELVTGDACWQFTPHDNGRHGGGLTLTDEAFDAYSDYLLQSLFTAQ